LSNPDDIVAGKRALRVAAIARRQGLTAIERAEAARRLASIGLPLPSLDAGSAIAGFASLPEELDVVPLLERLHGAGHRICLPVMQGKAKPLAFRAWAPGDVMDVKLWGIREPNPDQPELEPDVLLVPLLAFDRHGWRLGYGGGFYDRTLRAHRTRNPITAIGVGFADQEVDAVPHLDYDERLDGVLTPEGLRLFVDRVSDRV
jgi:5-formyltetrahydrofolate cyclo-ligase